MTNAKLHELMTQLVQIDSTSGSLGELVALRFVADWMERESGTEYALTWSPGTETPSAVLLSPREINAPLLLFCGHIDVVPVGDPAAWVHDPFSAKVVQDRMMGRGTSDMKSGLAAAMIAVSNLLRDGRAVALLVTTGEEAGCRGASVCTDILAALPIGAVIVPESTAGEVALGHRGALWLRVQTRGKAAHGSTPERGVNAIERAAGLMARIPLIPLRSHPHLGDESVNVGTIHAGIVPNIVPDQCEIQIDLRVVGDSRHLLSWWENQPEVSEVSVQLDLAPVWTARDHRWLDTLDATIVERPVSYFTDASVLTRALQPGTPIVVWGPGDPGSVHSLNESVSLKATETALNNYLRVGSRWARPSERLDPLFRDGSEMRGCLP